MNEAMIMVGGAVWLVVLLTLVGYGTILAAARNLRGAVISCLCAAFAAWLGIFGIVSAPSWADYLYR